MTKSLQPIHVVLALSSRSAARLATLLILGAFFVPVARSQTFQVIHTFSGNDGQNPYTGLTTDASGKLYGTTFLGGAANYGTVFRLTASGSSWILAPLYNFEGGSDGACPWSRLVVEADGTLYGTTSDEASPCPGQNGHGTVFQIRPPATACKTVLCPWSKTVLYAFSGDDGYVPSGDFVFDDSGNLYGTTRDGGQLGFGTVYQLTPSGGGWTENTLYTFTNQDTLDLPTGGVLFDRKGNLYGTAAGAEYGGIFELTPSGSGWQYTEVYALHGGAEGAIPMAGLIFDQNGNLYGATTFEGGQNGGTVFGLTSANGSWALSTLYTFTGVCCDLVGPWGTLVMDAKGNLYGTTNEGGALGYGTVFKLTPSNNGWTYTALHSFSGRADGAYPKSNVVIDANGNLYGTATNGGSSACPLGCGVVWEITP